MGKASILVLLKVLMIVICTGWITLWLLKPTQLWTRKWKGAEASALHTVFGYYGLDFAVYTFPITALAMIGLVYLNVQPWEQRSRQIRTSAAAFSNPVVISHLIGILSSVEILAVSFFILFLAWTFYARISQDFKKLEPVETLKLDLWQLKYLRVATRFGLLAEACLALLLLPILRGLAVFRILGIRFEASVRYHTWLGTAMICFATFHGASTLLIWGISHHLQDEITKWQRTGRIYLAGEIGLVTVLFMGITSLPPIRRKKFEIFYYTHHLYIIFLAFFLLHAGDRHFYMIFSGIFLFGLDKLLRIIQSWPETCVLSARLYPCKAVELILPKDTRLNYNPTSIIFMKIPSISKLQWHSFSITSSSTADNQRMSVIIKCNGWWTNSLYEMIQADLDSDADKKCIPVAIEGPYGPSSMTFLRYDSLLMVAGGVGITPFLSILQEVAAVRSSSRYRLPSRIQLIYVVKKPQDIMMSNSISSLLQNHPSQKWHLKLQVFVTQEQQSGETVREILSNETSQVQTVHFGAKGSTYAIHGPESLLWLAALAGIASVVFLVFLICFNHIFLPSEKKSHPSLKLVATSKKKSPKEKGPSWIADIIIVASFIVSIACSSLVAIILRWRRLKKEIPLVSQKEEKVKEIISSIETTGSVEEHEVHFGGRPNLKDVLARFLNETDGSNAGVLVCGPESMKQDVASLCRQKSPCFKVGDENSKPYVSFHALNFTL